MSPAATAARAAVSTRQPPPRGVTTRDDVHGDIVLDADVVIVGPGSTSW